MQLANILLYHVVALLVLAFPGDVAIASLQANHSPAKSWSLLENQFRDPVDETGPYVLWQWMNGWISKNGIKKDVEAMKASGYSGAQIFNVGVGIPRGPVDYGTDEWFELLEYAAEQFEEHNLKMTVVQSPGYSGAGGPWISPNMSMQELVWTESRWTGNVSEMKLPKPLAKLNYYEDIAVYAYPALPEESRGPIMDEVSQVSLDGENSTFRQFGTIDPENKVRLAAGSILQFTTQDYFTAQSISIYRVAEIPLDTFDGARDYPPTWTLSASNGSDTWSQVAKFSGPALRQLDAPAVASFSAVTYKHWRLIPSGPSWLTGVDLTSGPRLENWAIKAHASPGTQPAAARNLTSNVHTIKSSDVIDITEFMSMDGTLSWNATGRYTIFRFGHTTTGQDMPAAPGSAESGLALDIYSSEAVDFHIKHHLSRIISQLKRFIPGTFEAISIDSYELGMQTWTPKMLDAFYKYLGYEIGPYLLSSAGVVLDSVQSTEQYLADLRSVHSNLVTDQYYSRFTEYANENGIIFATEPYGDGPFDSMDVSTAVDSAYGEFWARYTYGSDAYSQIGTSAMHQQDYQVNFAESFTGQPQTSRWTEAPYSLKAEGDRMFTLGVNRIFVHCYALQYEDHAFPGMTMGPFGAHFDRKITWTNQASGWTDYIKRSQLLLQQSKSVSEIACFTGEEPTASLTQTYSSPCSVPVNYGTDLIGKRSLLQAKAVDGRARLPSGYSYRLIIFPELPVASEALLRKVKALQDAGVAILFQGDAPSRAMGLLDSGETVTTMAESLYSDNPLQGLSTESALKKLGIELDFQVTAASNNAAVYAQRRQTNGYDIFFVSNGRREHLHASIELTASASKGRPCLWYPERGVVTPASYVRNGDGVHVSLNMLPAESLFIVFSGRGDYATSVTGVAVNGSSILQAKGYPSFDPMPYSSVSSTFTITFWAKPETFRRGNTGYVYYPPPASTMLGSGHAATGFGLGSNGFVVVESTSSVASVYSVDLKIEGWSHFAVVYQKETPRVYVNGRLVGTGPVSKNTVHPGVGTPDRPEQFMNKFEGDTTEIQVDEAALDANAIKALFDAGPGWLADSTLLRPESDGSFVIKENGRYEFQYQDGTTSSEVVTSVFSRDLSNPWTVEFPPGNGIDAAIELPEASSLRLHDDFDVAHFSGTAKWSTRLTVPKFSTTSSRVFIDFNRVENIARVFVNGREAGLLWKAPWELDITDHVRPGASIRLTVEVTNLWPNRMIGDESLPQEAEYNSTNQNFAVLEFPIWFRENKPKPGSRVTFSAWDAYNSTDPLFDTGILGPVRILVAHVRHSRS